MRKTKLYGVFAAPTFLLLLPKASWSYASRNMTRRSEVAIPRPSSMWPVRFRVVLKLVLAEVNLFGVCENFVVYSFC